MKAVRRGSAKSKNLIEEMHHRIATSLVSNYDVVLIGKPGNGVMKSTRKGKRVLQMLTLLRCSHTASEGLVILKVGSCRQALKPCRRVW